MISIRSYGPADYITMPWKNGGGTTTELARGGGAGGDGARGGGASEDYGWRLSIADITADGPFSSFSGRQRIISVLEGAGIRLTVEGRAGTELTPFIPFPFDGGVGTECTLLDGPVRDLNLIYRRDAYWARFEWVAFPAARGFITAAPTVLLVNFGTDVALRSAETAAQTVKHGELLRLDNSGPALELRLSGAAAGKCAVIELYPRGTE